jgi:hypothetical protein
MLVRSPSVFPVSAAILERIDDYRRVLVPHRNVDAILDGVSPVRTKQQYGDGVRFYCWVQTRSAPGDRALWLLSEFLSFIESSHLCSEALSPVRAATD